MDAEEAEGSLKLLLILLALFLFSMVKSCNEVRFLAVGKTATTEIAEVLEARSPKGRHLGYHFVYAFHNENTDKRVGDVILSDDPTTFRVGEAIEIEYIGKTAFVSRLKGDRSYFWPGVFFIMIGVMVWHFRRPLNSTY